MTDIAYETKLRTIVRELADDNRAIRDHLGNLALFISQRQHRKGIEIFDLLEEQKGPLRAIEQSLLVASELLKIE